jgi:hypothetical protein
MTNEEITRFFNETLAFIQGNPDLRDPQVEGWDDAFAGNYGAG